MRSYRIELREKDIDAFGHVHYAEYLSFCAQARNLWLADIAIARPGDHVVARIEADYLATTRLVDGHVSVGISVGRIGRSSLELRESIAASGDRQAVLMRTVVVRYDPAAGRSVAWTDAEREILQTEIHRG